MVTKRRTRASMDRVLDVGKLTDRELIRCHEQMFGRLTAMTRKRLLDAARPGTAPALTDVALAA